jgi:copper(I)-binding protein
MRSPGRLAHACLLAVLGGTIGCPASDRPAERATEADEAPGSTRPASTPSSRPIEAGQAATRVEVMAARARAMPPSAANSAAFMTLRNPGPAAALVAARADVSEAVELHTHAHVDGVMKMRRVSEIELPAGAEIALEPGGLHVMLIGLNDPLEAGERFDLTLVFDDGSEKAVEVEVRSVEPPRSAP